jgi:hypothetical protein
MNSWVKNEGLELGQELLDHFDLNSEGRIWRFCLSEFNNQQFQLAFQVASDIFVFSFFNADLSIYSHAKGFFLCDFMNIFKHLNNLGHDNNFFYNFLDNVWNFDDPFFSDQDWIKIPFDDSIDDL